MNLTKPPKYILNRDGVIAKCNHIIELHTQIHKDINNYNYTICRKGKKVMKEKLKEIKETYNKTISFNFEGNLYLVVISTEFTFYKGLLTYRFTTTIDGRRSNIIGIRKVLNTIKNG